LPRASVHGYEINGWKALALHVTIAKEDAFDIQCIIYMMYRGHYKHDRTLLNAINKASSGTARRSRNGSEALRPTV